MRLAVSLGLFMRRSGPAEAGPAPSCRESLRRCAAAGFRVASADFSDLVSGGSEFAAADWERRAAELREEAERLGLAFSQARLPRHPDLVERALAASAILGASWAIAEPYASRGERAYDREADLELNRRLYGPVAEEAAARGLGLAFENPPATAAGGLKRRFASTAEELAALVDAFGDERVGASWDFGHGNRSYADQRRALGVLGSRLRATRVDDNRDRSDARALPFIGGTDWASCLPALSEIAYRGDLCLEPEFMDRLPDALRDEFARLAFALGTRCLELAQGRAA